MPHAFGDECDLQFVDFVVGAEARALDQLEAQDAFYEAEVPGRAVAEAEARRKAAEEEAHQRRTLADAQAYEIRKINEAVSSNPAYLQLQALDALKQMSKDPAAKIYFLDGDAPQPLPLMNIGDR